jgi:2-oxoglutarate/2-oxoacid ferredoxin oxidoreductase subunit alpha
MRLSVLIGGKAGQGINKISQIISDVMADQGYFTFNYRDYPSIIRGGHNFNILTISNERVGSHESKIDFILAMDKNTIKVHKKELKKGGIIIANEQFKDLGINLNIALAGAFIKLLGINKTILLSEIKKTLNSKESVKAAEQGFDSQEVKFNLKKIKNKITIMSGSQAIAKGAINSKIDRYIAYPMTPATGVMHELAAKQIEHNYMVFQPENEIAVVNAALGASFTGAKTMIGTSGGGFDLMSEGLSLQGITEIPLVTYLASRPGPGTGVPTYSTQGDLNIALRAGHGEFPRIVIAPGDPTEAIEKTNEAFYLSNKFNCLSILLGDKHLAESEFSTNKKPKKPLKIIRKGKLPGKAIVKVSSYEHDNKGNTTEDPKIIKKNQEARLKKYELIKKEAKKFEMIKIYGKKNSKKLIVGWGSTKGVILDAIKDTDYKFLQVLYLKPMSNQIKKELQKANKIVLVENNLTGQLGRIIKEKTGIKIKNRILRYDSRPFLCDELSKEIRKKLK